MEGYRGVYLAKKHDVLGWNVPLMNASTVPESYETESEVTNQAELSEIGVFSFLKSSK